MTDHPGWPDIPLQPWAGTCVAMHIYCQIVGKYRLAHTPWINHSWHATLYVTANGLTTGLIPDGGGVTIDFDLKRQCVVVSSAQGEQQAFALDELTVAEFDHRFKEAVSLIGGNPTYNGLPNEMPLAVPFGQDNAPRPWDASAVQRYHRALVSVKSVFEAFRTGFLGKVSPVHLFWGSFDLAVTRFSGSRAPLHPGGIPNLPDAVTREAYSHEVSSAGFWPGGGGIEEPCFYSYAYPSPAGFADYPVEPAGSRYDLELGEFILPYAAVQSAADPATVLMQFLQSTYRAATTTGDWNTMELDCDLGVAGVPRIVE